MAWVALGTAAIGGVAAVASADAKASAGGGSGGGGGGPGGMDFRTASAASYGTTIGNDGWSINFGSGTQIASPKKTTTSTYPTEQNPLTALQPRLVADQPMGYTAAGFDPTTLVMLGVGALLIAKIAKRK